MRLLLIHSIEHDELQDGLQPQLVTNAFPHLIWVKEGMYFAGSKSSWKRCSVNDVLFTMYEISRRARERYISLFDAEAMECTEK
jgi:hypothetical protein